MNITLATLAAILAAVEAGEIETNDAVEELNRRIEKRAAAGKHPMVHVVAARDDLAALIPA
jgi:Asp-tRNA(Asn)/Glu-tRNA(Gln) amidotransferase A subunit family amidase